MTDYTQRIACCMGFLKYFLNINQIKKNSNLNLFYSFTDFRFHMETQWWTESGNTCLVGKGLDGDIWYRKTENTAMRWLQISHFLFDLEPSEPWLPSPYTRILIISISHEFFESKEQNIWKES